MDNPLIRRALTFVSQDLGPVADYEVYRHFDNGYAAVKKGFCWPAFFFYFFWAAWYRLWPQAFGYWFAFTGYNLAKKTLGPGSPLFSDVVLPFAALVILLIGGFLGNEWRETKLQSKGYRWIGSVKARSPRTALRYLHQRNEEA